MSRQSELDEALWSEVYRLISITFMQRGSLPYFTLDFFRQISRALPNDILVVMAEKDEEPIAAAVFFVGDDALYGRRQPPVLHSERQRTEQAQAVNDFVNEILDCAPNANVVVLGVEYRPSQVDARSPEAQTVGEGGPVWVWVDETSIFSTAMPHCFDAMPLASSLTSWATPILSTTTKARAVVPSSSTRARA